MAIAGLLFAVILAASPVPVTAQTPSFTADAPLTSDSGHALVEWEGEGPVALSIERDSAEDAARELYRGPNHAYFVSGLDDGAYVLRLTDAGGTETDVATLEVRHQSLSQALWLALLGALVTLAVVATILRGARDE